MERDAEHPIARAIVATAADRGITVPGPVTVMDNVLAITTGDHGSGPITISHVTYA